MYATVLYSCQRSSCVHVQMVKIHSILNAVVSWHRSTNDTSTHLTTHKSHSFTESQLKENCPRPVDLDAFRNIRKQLTDFYVLGAKVHNMTEKVKKGQTDYLIQIKLDVIPNILPLSFIQQVVKVKKDTEHRSANANETWF